MSKIFYPNQQIFFTKTSELDSFFNENGFYLMGGTALALQIEHRTSIDFDFATNQDLDTDSVLKILNQYFDGLLVTQLEQNTLSVSWNDVKVSFFGGISLKTISPLNSYMHLKLLSIDDISAMKLRTILSRSTLKDYFDLAFLVNFENFIIKDIIQNFYMKYEERGNQFPEELLLKTLIFTDDIEDKAIEIIKYKDFWGETNEEIIAKVTEVLASNVKEFINTKLS